MSEIGDKKIVVIGAGNMGSALIRGLVKSVAATQVTAVDIDSELLARLHDAVGVHTSEDANVAVAAADIVVIAIKPQHLSDVSGVREAMTPDHLVVSIVAGVSSARAGTAPTLITAVAMRLKEIPVRVMSTFHVATASSHLEDSARRFPRSCLGDRSTRGRMGGRPS